MKIYGIFFTRNGKLTWGMNRNKRNAIAFVKSVGNGEVRALSDVPEINAYDSSTFRYLSQRIFKI